MRLVRSFVLLAVLACFPSLVSAQITPMAQGSGLAVTIAPTLVVRAEYTSNTATFTVSNTGTTSITAISLACSAGGPVSCGTVTPGSIFLLKAGQSKSVAVGYTTGLSGSATLTLTATPDEGTSALKVLHVTVGTPEPPGVVLANSSADTWDRSHCLLAGAGEAAWRCGDLVVAHGLPGFATLGRERALTLVHTSAQAVPRPVVTARLTPPALTSGLTGFWVGLKVDGVWRDSARYLPWTTGTRQVALAFDAAGLATGAYAFDLEVRSEYGAASHGTLTSGTLAVVNRAASAYGQGWSLGGVEMLVSGQPGGSGTGLLWVGGEGSARLYARQAADTNRWVAPAGAFRDTIVRSPATGEYTRTLRHGIRVVFDATGRHLATINRVGQRTDFDWTGSQLTAVRVPPDTVARPTYVLAYDGAGKLDRITDPAGRVLEATVSAGRLTTLTDPDAKATTFDYDTPGRMIRRTNRRGFGTRFDYAKGLRVTEVRVPIGTGADSAITGYAPWDEQGLATAFANQVAVDTAQVVTKVFGPRVGVADDATFRVDRWGAPVRITDALGAVTTLLRGNDTVPALVTRVTYPNGRKVDLAWDGRGNLTEERVITTGLADAQPDLVTRYWYTAPQTQDAPDSVIAPGGIVTRFAYRADGILDRATAPNGHVTDFDYITSGALIGTLRAVRELNVPVWDSVLRKEVNQPSLSQRFGVDALGNVVADTSLGGRVRSFTRDASARVTDAYDPAGHHVSYVYDAVNRLREVREHLEEVPGSGYTSPLLTKYTYGTELVDSIFDPRNVRRTYRYDAAGRLVAEGDEAGAEEQYTLDAGGLVLAVQSRRGHIVTHSYDAAGRKAQVAWPVVDGQASGSLILTYDNVNQLVRAESQGRKLARSYYATGALKRDSSNLVVEYGYDEAGRRSWYRTRLDTTVKRDSVVYRYAPVTGDLATIAVRWWGQATLSDSVQFRWDSLGRRDTLLYSHGAKVLFMYDEDGALRVLCGTHPGALTGPLPTAFNFALVHTWVDQDGMLRSTDTGVPGITGCGGGSYFNPLQLDADNTYDARHQLTGQELLTGGWTFKYDASGNRVEETHDGKRWSYSHPTNSNRVTDKQMLEGTPCGYEGGDCWYEYTHNADGSRTSDQECYEGVGCSLVQGYGYDALGRPRCTYDPLGRLLHTCIVGGSPDPLGYEGENVIRTNPENTNVFWAFVHGPGIDDPVLGRYQRDIASGATYFFVTDGQGRQYVVGRSDGQNGSADEDYTLGGGTLSGAGQVSNAFDVERLPADDAPGLAFFRNRFYDQETGRWTQEDPIGVAGGLNLYGFVGNNPATFTDPFGLCPKHMRGNVEECNAWNMAQVEAAREIVEGAAAAGKAYVLPTSGIRLEGVNDDHILSKCRGSTNTSDVGCVTSANVIILNADREPQNIAGIIQHELQHAYGEPAERLDSRSPFGEPCAVRRELLAGRSLGVRPDRYARPTSYDPTIQCGFGD